MSVRTVLVVDDSPTERFYLSDILRKHGYEVTPAAARRAWPWPRRSGPT